VLLLPIFSLTSLGTIQGLICCLRNTGTEHPVTLRLYICCSLSMIVVGLERR
jgi:hypothetical protein